MRRILLISFYLILVTSVVCGQKTKKIKNIDNRANTFESFEVLKSNSEVRNGEYIYRFDGRVQVNGQFEQNKMNGEWIYTPDNNIKIVAYYKDGKKHGEWKCFYEDKLISTINYADGIKQGESIGYFKTGEIKCKEFYEDGKIVNKRSSFYKNGSIKETSEYKNGKLNGIKERFSEDGNLIFRIDYKNGVPFDLNIIDSTTTLLMRGNLKNGNGKLVNYSVDINTEDVIIRTERNFENGKLHGPINGYDHKGNLMYRGQYINGYMVGMWSFNLNNKEKQYNEVYHFADSLETDTMKWFLDFSENFFDPDMEMPKFNNKDVNEFRKHIESALVYPYKAQKLGIKGRVLVKFTVNKLGVVSNVKLLNSVNKYLDEEALRVVKSSPLWTPGFKDNIPVDVVFAFPIVFQLR